MRPRSDDVAERVFHRELAASVTNRTMHLIVLPTEQCNFRCTYCYEAFEIGRMKPELVQAMKRFLDRRLDSLDQLNISWFGGEPLLAKAVIEDISSHVMASPAWPRLTYLADVTTNGYQLDVPTADRLSKVQVRMYQISLDGPEEFHDLTRVRADGGGSFARIWRNLLALKDSSLPIRITLRVHLTPANVSVMPDFVDRLETTFLSDERFSLLLRPVEKMGGPNDDAMQILGDAAGARAIAELEARLGGSARASTGISGPEVCYASRPNSLVIRANGDIGKCTVALSDSANSIGRLLPDGTLQIHDSRLAPWVRGWSSGDWEELGCPYRGLPRQASPLLQIGIRPSTSRQADGE